MSKSKKLSKKVVKPSPTYRPAPKPTTGTKIETPLSRVAKTSDPKAALDSLQKGKALSRVVNAPDKPAKEPKQPKNNRTQTVVKMLCENKHTDEEIHAAASKEFGDFDFYYIAAIRSDLNHGRGPYAKCLAATGIAHLDNHKPAKPAKAEKK